VRLRLWVKMFDIVLGLSVARPSEATTLKRVTKL